jgi:hypothetical protein
MIYNRMIKKRFIGRIILWQNHLRRRFNHRKQGKKKSLQNDLQQNDKKEIYWQNHFMTKSFEEEI